MSKPFTYNSAFLDGQRHAERKAMKNKIVKIYILEIKSKRQKTSNIHSAHIIRELAEKEGRKIIAPEEFRPSDLMYRVTEIMVDLSKALHFIQRECEL